MTRQPQATGTPGLPGRSSTTGTVIARVVGCRLGPGLPAVDGADAALDESAAISKNIPPYPAAER